MADVHADKNQDEWNEETVYGPSTVIAALDQIEDLVESSRALPLSASILINKAEILDLLDQAREALPEDLVAADAVVADADAVLGRADSAAETRIAEANSRASSTLDQANERAAQIRSDAEEEAERTRARADAEATALISQARADAEATIADANAHRLHREHRAHGRRPRPRNRLRSQAFGDPAARGCRRLRRHLP